MFVYNFDAEDPKAAQRCQLSAGGLYELQTHFYNTIIVSCRQKPRHKMLHPVYGAALKHHEKADTSVKCQRLTHELD